MKIYLLAVLRIANAEDLPFDWAATCSEFVATIDEYEAPSGSLTDLTAARAAILALQSALGRILVSVNYAREPCFRHDTAHTVPKLPTLSIAAELGRFEDDGMRRVAQTELLRGQNRYVGSINQAQHLIEAACR